MNKQDQIKQLAVLEQEAAELGKGIATLKQEIEKADKKIDFSGFSPYVIEQGLLVEVKDILELSPAKRYFVSVEGSYRVKSAPHVELGTNWGTTGVCWKHIRLLDNKPIHWFGGDCPIPDGVRFKYWNRSGTSFLSISHKASNLRWNSYFHDTDVIAFQILESEWQS